MLLNKLNKTVVKDNKFVFVISRGIYCTLKMLFAVTILLIIHSNLEGSLKQNALSYVTVSGKIYIKFLI